MNLGCCPANGEKCKERMHFVITDIAYYDFASCKSMEVLERVLVLRPRSPFVGFWILLIMLFLLSLLSALHQNHPFFSSSGLGSFFFYANSNFIDVLLLLLSFFNYLDHWSIHVHTFNCVTFVLRVLRTCYGLYIKILETFSSWTLSVILK